jgi:hypothetical protein
MRQPVSPASNRLRSWPRVSTFPLKTLIAMSLYGISYDQNRHRARVTVRLTSEPDVPRMVIVPFNAQGSPFNPRGQDLFLGGDVIGHVRRVDADEAIGGYIHDGGWAATLNLHARSRCVGCAFCPNTLEAAADPRPSEERELTDLLAAMVEQHPLVEQVTECRNLRRSDALEAGMPLEEFVAVVVGSDR